MPLALTSLLIAMLSIQTGASIAKGLFVIAGPTTATALRVGFAALILVTIGRPWRTPLSKEQKRDLLFYGSSLGFMNMLFYLSLQRIPLGIAVSLEFTGPLAVSLLASKRWTDILWASFAATGLYLILPHSNATVSSLDMTGVLLALGAGFFWALYILFGKRVSATTPSTTAAAWGMLAAALVTVPFGFKNPTAFLDLKILGLGLGLAVLSSAIPYSLEMLALKKIPIKTFGILMSGEPAMAALMGYFFLHEALTPVQLVAIGCIIVASAGSSAFAKQ